jgi:outer membrane protein TolC
MARKRDFGPALAACCLGIASVLAGAAPTLAEDPPGQAVAYIPGPEVPVARAKGADPQPAIPPVKGPLPVPVPVLPGGAKEPEQAPMPTPAPQVGPSPPRLKPGPEVLAIDLPTALRLANAANPTIALARERVVEAYARLRQAQVLWLPTLQTGPAYTRHDGRLQNSRGDVFSVSKSSIFEGGGAVLSVGTSDALFAPLIARRLVEAQVGASRAVRDEVQLQAALTYLDLVQVYAALAINTETLARVKQMTDAAEAAVLAKKSKTGADLPRALTELNLRRDERIDLEGQAAVVSARLAQLLLLEPTVDLRPLDPAVLPIALVPEDQVPIEELVATGLLNRPELAESRSLVAAAVTRWRQARFSPLLPRLEAAYNAGTFGGDHGENLMDFGSRSDGTAQIIWELPGLGAGYVAQNRVQRSLVNQANLHVTEVEAQVAAEVTAAVKVALNRRRALASAQEAVTEAERMWRRLRAAAFGMAGAQGRFDPLEPLLAEQALSQARLQYLTQVIEYNKAQFRLYRALGQPPLEALPKATALPVHVPVTPGRLAPDSETLPRVTAGVNCGGK